MALKGPITISFAVHAAFVLALVCWVSYFSVSYLSGGGGGQGVVTVWISGTSDSHAAKARILRPNSATIEGKVAQKSAEAGSNAGTEGSAGEGEGTGPGTGGGIGHGKDGDPLLKNIWKKINSSKYYPHAARKQGLEGTPRVTFVIGEDGSVMSVDIATSSGETVLDDAAKETVRRAAPLPYYPKPITLAVKYSLKE